MMEITEGSLVKNCLNPTYNLCMLSLYMKVILHGGGLYAFLFINVQIFIECLKRKYFCFAGTKVVSRDESVLWGHGQTGGQPQYAF